MGQPHLPRIRLFTELCRLLEHHMLILPRVGNFFLLTVHALADKEVIVRGIFGDCRNRARVSRVGNGNSAALFSQHHVRGQDLTLVLDGLAFLQSAPEFLRNLLGSRPFHIKFAVSRDRNAISIAGHAVVYAECVAGHQRHVPDLSVPPEVPAPCAPRFPWSGETLEVR